MTPDIPKYTYRVKLLVATQPLHIVELEVIKGDFTVIFRTFKRSNLSFLSHLFYRSQSPLELEAIFQLAHKTGKDFTHKLNKYTKGSS